MSRTPYTTFHETLDFCPAPVGWTVYYFNSDEPGTMSNPLAGWEVQAQNICHSNSLREVDDQPPLTERPRRVVPVDMDHTGYMDDPTTVGNFWIITGPGEPAPTDAETVEAWHKWDSKQEATR